MTAPAETKRCYARHPSPVSAVCAVVGGRPTGMVCTSVTAVSLDPPVVTVSIRKQSTTWPVLREASALGVSLLAQGQNDIAHALAYLPAGERFTHVATSTTYCDALMVNDAAVTYLCRLTDELEIGDHLVAVLAVITSTSDPGRQPLTFLDNAMY